MGWQTAVREMDDVWLIVPVFNEGAVITDVLTEVLQTFPHVVCVDDGSTDESAAEIARTGAELVKHPINLGQGAALQTGVEYARGRPGARFFVTFDADGQHRVTDAELMVQRLRTEQVDIVIGTRFTGDSSQIPPLKRVVLRTAIALNARARRLGLTDLHNGLRAFNRRVASQLDITSLGMGHAAEFLEQIEDRNWRVAEQAVHVRYTDYSKGKGQSLLNGVNILFDSAVRSQRR